MKNELVEIFKHRELIIRLSFRELKLKYRKPFLGFLWAFLIPLFTVFIFQIVFSIILKISIREYPYFIYLMTAIFPWRYFQFSISRATTSILDSQNLINKVNFPKILIPISIIMAELINFIPTLLIMFVIILSSQPGFSLSIFYLPLVVLLHTLFMIGFSLIVSTLQVKYRDIKYIVETLLLGLFYLTPVFYSIEMVSKIFNDFLFRVYLFNPLVEIVNLYRISFLDNFYKSLPGNVSYFYILGVPIIWTILLLSIGLWVFKKNEKLFVDYLSR